MALRICKLLSAVGVKLGQSRNQPEEDPIPEFDDARLKHLEMIQAVIGRLGNNGFVVKGSATTLTVAFLGVAVNNDKWHLALVGLLPAISFWALDAYMLKSERLFRVLYEKVRLGEANGMLMNATDSGVLDAEDRRKNCWFHTLWRPVLLFFYGALAASCLAVSVILHCT